MKKSLLWLAMALFLTTICVPPTVLADGGPNPQCDDGSLCKPKPPK